MKLLNQLNEGNGLLKVGFVVSIMVHLLLGYLVNKLYFGELAYVEGKVLRRESPVIELAIYSKVNQKKAISKVNLGEEEPQLNQEKFKIKSALKKKVEIKDKEIIKEDSLKEVSKIFKKERVGQNIQKKEKVEEVKAETKPKKSLENNIEALKSEGKVGSKLKDNKKLERKTNPSKNISENEVIEEATKVEDDSSMEESKDKVEVEDKKEILEDREVKKNKSKKEELGNKRREANKSDKREDNTEVINNKKINKDNKIIVDLTNKKADKGVSAPTIIQYKRPDYPKRLIRRKIEGRVLLKVLIDNKGIVEEVQLAKSSGYSEFDSTAQQVVKKWEFNPTKKGNVEVYSWVLIPISFRLD